VIKLRLKLKYATVGIHLHDPKWHSS